MKLWTGRFSKEIDKKTNDFNSSIPFDSRMYKEDITGSMAHATMLGATGINSKEDTDKILNGLQGILDDIESGKLTIDPEAEDIHTFVEGELTSRIGDAGKRLHTSRSRNDQVALDDRLVIKTECDKLIPKLEELITILCKMAKEYSHAIMPGYTHLQRAQPIVFGHHLMAYVEMFLRDISRLNDAKARMMSQCPLGSGALAGTTYPIDRNMTAKALGFDGPCMNSLDGVSDRDFFIEFASALSLISVHLSRFAEEIIMWCSWEFKFVELDDAFSTGSSIMPQKKNPDICELVRGKVGRVYGDLMSLLTAMKGLPLAYNKDMQEDKEPAFDAIDTAQACIPLFAEMLRTITFRKEVMEKSAMRGFTNATDAADYLVGKGVPFRDAHGMIGRLVLHCLDAGKAIEELPLEELKEFSPQFEQDVYDAISLRTCVNRRLTTGAPGEEAMKEEIAASRAWLQAQEN